MAVSWIEYKGKKILVTEYQNLSEEGKIAAIKEQGEIVKNSLGKVLLLDDFRDVYVTKRFMDAIKEVGKEMGPKTEKNAVLGVFGVKKILLKAYNFFVPLPAVPFDTKEEALEYLVS